MVRALIEPDVLELEDHVELAAFRCRELDRLRDGDQGHLADGEHVAGPAVEHLAVHLPQVLVVAGADAEVLVARPVRRPGPGPPCPAGTCPC